MCFYYVNGSHVCCVSLNTYLVMARDGCFICTRRPFYFPISSSDLVLLCVYSVIYLTVVLVGLRF